MSENTIEELGQRIIDRPATLADQMYAAAQTHPGVLELVRGIGQLQANLYEALLGVADGVLGEGAEGTDLETGLAVAATVTKVSGDALELGRMIFETNIHEDAGKMVAAAEAAIARAQRVPVDPTGPQGEAGPKWTREQHVVDEHGRVHEVLAVGLDSYFMRVVGGRLYLGEPRESSWGFEGANECRLLGPTECVDREGVHAEHDFDDFGGLGLCRRCGAEAYEEDETPLRPAIDRALERDHSACGKNPCSDCR